jgi:hypothetical protein
LAFQKYFFPAQLRRPGAVDLSPEPWKHVHMTLMRHNRGVLLPQRKLTGHGNDPATCLGRLFLSSGSFLAVLLFVMLSFEPSGSAQPTPNPTNSAAAGTPEAQLAALRLEMSNACQRVRLIVNRPVRAYARTANMSVSIYSPGWFHDGAAKPDFTTVDVRQTQELTYAKKQFVTSDLNPGIVFLGPELEFNSMTKYFYTNRTMPKRKLTEPEMLEINRLYRIIGRCEGEIDRLQAPPVAEAAQPATNETETEAVIPGQSFESIRKIPKQTRIIYSAIAICVLILLVVALRVRRKKSG